MNSSITIKGQKGLSKLVFIVIILVVLVVGGGATVTALLLMGGDEENVIDEEHIGETAAEKEEREKEEAQNGGDGGVKREAKFWSIEPPLVVNYDNFGKKGFLQVAVSVMTYDSSVLDRVNKNSPIIRNNLLLLFNGRKYEDLIGSENQLRMQQECLDEVNRVLQEYTGKGGVDNIFFTAYVMQ